MANTGEENRGTPARRRSQHDVYGVDIAHDLRDGQHGSTIGDPMTHVDDPHVNVNRGKCPLKRERASTLPTPIPWPLQPSSTPPFIVDWRSHGHFNHHHGRGHHDFWHHELSRTSIPMTVTVNLPIDTQYRQSISIKWFWRPLFNWYLILPL